MKARVKTKEEMLATPGVYIDGDIYMNSNVWCSRFVFPHYLGKRLDVIDGRDHYRIAGGTYCFDSWALVFDEEPPTKPKSTDPTHFLTCRSKEMETKWKNSLK